MITANDLQFEIKATIEDRQIIFIVGSVCVVLDRKGIAPQQNISVLVFTKIGQELLQLIDNKPELDYIQLFASKIRGEGMVVRFANILQSFEGQIRHDGLVDVPLTEHEIKQNAEQAKS